MNKQSMIFNEFYYQHEITGISLCSAINNVSMKNNAV